jgi:NAD(P)-dependent dehydrogenase (short-subunit alcohol dehydrogenase family)
MIYFVTGASGFIGKRFIRQLFTREGTQVYILTRGVSAEGLSALHEFCGADGRKLVAIEGDITQKNLGLDAKDIRKLRGKIDHVVHLAAIYDLSADPGDVARANIDGTRNALDFARTINAGCFHHISSIAAAGLYEGVFREDMFEEARHLEHPYFSSKHESEKIVRAEKKIAWRIYRPGIVVGDSRTGEMDKIDGPYYFFKLIQKIRRTVPQWMPAIGLEGGRINVVPVDFVVAALDHLVHEKGLDGRTFHLTDPSPMRLGDMLNLFAGAAHAPKFSLRINAAMFGFVPGALVKSLMSITPFRRIRKLTLRELGLPEDIINFINYPTRFDSRETQKILAKGGVKVPRLEDYAWKLWDYWERHLDPDLFVDRSLRGRVQGKRVLVTGGSVGIGKSVAHRLASAGAVTIICARDAEALEATREEFAAEGLKLVTYSADIADPAACAKFVDKLLADHGGVDILVNNAGRSIRRSIEQSYDRTHDLERTMRVNYFGAVQVAMGVLPGMAGRREGHIVNVSSIGVLTNAPRFSAYVASKAALEAWSNCAASEFLDRGVHFTSVNMPLVRTAMTAPTKFYSHVPTLDPDEAAELVVDAIIHRPSRVATRLGTFGQVIHALLPNFAHIIMNTAFRMFPDTANVKGEPPSPPTADQIAFTQVLRGLHL